MNVAVLCEFSGVVRRAFEAEGHLALSFDLLPSEDRSPFHLLRDVRDVPWGSSELGDFDLAICFPPCTHLALSGARWWKDRRDDQREAVRFVRWLETLPIPRIAIENPIGHLSTAWRKPDQIIQPWQFGHPERKATCLWLKNLPPLQPTRVMKRREPRVHWEAPGPDRWKRRSRTLRGIGRAMARQWGEL